MESEGDVIEYKHFRIPHFFKTRHKSSPPPEVLFPWDKKTGLFIKKGFPFRYNGVVLSRGGLTICTITQADGMTFMGIVVCSLSQVYLVDYGEDAALNRANVLRGHDCVYCRNTHFEDRTYDHLIFGLK